ncbi:hypothetical protein BH11MYX3_BH11MYX3_21010 [soil metagenome]
MELPPDWSEFISLLSRHRVKFLLIGAHALAVHGRVRATLDLDVFVEPSVLNAQRIGAVLVEFGFPESAAQCDHLARPDRMMRLGREPLRIDILNQISGVSFATAWRNRIKGDFGGHRLNVISLGDYRRNKKASGRTKDLFDLALLDEGATPAASRSRSTRPRPVAPRSRTRGTAAPRTRPKG